MLSSAVLVLTASMVVGQAEQGTPLHKGLLEFQPYIGKWVAEVTTPEDAPGLAQKGDVLPIVLTFRWAKNGNAVVAELGATIKGAFVELNQSLYVWDPQRKTIVGLDSAADGAMFRVEVTTKDGNLLFTNQGYKADGTSVSSIITYEPLTQDSFRGGITQRKEGKKVLSDLSPVVLTRAKE